MGGSHARGWWGVAVGGVTHRRARAGWCALPRAGRKEGAPDRRANGASARDDDAKRAAFSAERAPTKSPAQCTIGSGAHSEQRFSQTKGRFLPKRGTAPSTPPSKPKKRRRRTKRIGRLAKSAVARGLTRGNQDSLTPAFATARTRAARRWISAVLPPADGAIPAIFGRACARGTLDGEVFAGVSGRIVLMVDKAVQPAQARPSDAGFVGIGVPLAVAAAARGRESSIGKALARARSVALAGGRVCGARSPEPARPLERRPGGRSDVLETLGERPRRSGSMDARSRGVRVQDVARADAGGQASPASLERREARAGMGIADAARGGVGPAAAARCSRRFTRRKRFFERFLTCPRGHQRAGTVATRRIGTRQRDVDRATMADEDLRSGGRGGCWTIHAKMRRTKRPFW